MTHVTCRLTAKNWDQLWNPTLGNQEWATFFVKRVVCDWVLCCSERVVGGVWWWESDVVACHRHFQPAQSTAISTASVFYMQSPAWHWPGCQVHWRWSGHRRRRWLRSVHTAFHQISLPCCRYNLSYFLKLLIFFAFAFSALTLLVEWQEGQTTRVSRYQKGETNLDFTEARDSEWQWHLLGHMQICIWLQTDNHASTTPLSFYRPDARPAAQPTASKHWRQHSCQHSGYHIMMFCYVILFGFSGRSKWKVKWFQFKAKAKRLEYKRVCLSKILNALPVL